MCAPQQQGRDAARRAEPTARDTEICMVAAFLAPRGTAKPKRARGAPELRVVSGTRVTVDDVTRQSVFRVVRIDGRYSA